MSTRVSKNIYRHATLLLINVTLKRKSRLLSNFCILIYSIYNNNVTNNHSSCSRVKYPPHPPEKKQIKNMTWLWYLNRNSLSKSQPKGISIFNHNFIFLQYSWGMPYGHFHRNFGKFAPLIVFLYSTLSLWLVIALLQLYRSTISTQCTIYRAPTV